MSVAANITYRGKLLIDEPMSKHTSWRVGGKADHYYTPADLADLQAYLAALAPNIPITWVGLGSNMLVRDGGIRGEVIASLSGVEGSTAAQGWLRLCREWYYQRQIGPVLSKT